eukprot:TRINITY_DN54972_c0_g1_i1.p1 TRINITY_DN54972_c0_g1~~TRINITY_DN54972_c0_g1_i1.p1  ORF type:complete len:516 (-),score=106.15 TRINITY_DN54972_c0_g1_i1:63-1610(-)
MGACLNVQRLMDSTTEKLKRSRDGPPALAEVIDRLGMGRAQAITILLGGLVWFADGSELLIISSASKSVTDEWGLNAFQSGSVVSMVFIGILVGNLLSGTLGDTYGRLAPILASYFGSVVFSIASATAGGYWSLAILRLFVGMSFGVGQPAVQTLITETTPLAWRMYASGAMQTMFVFGEMYALLLIGAQDPQMKQLDWRALLRWGAAPAALFIVFCWWLLRESPNYLAVHGKYDEAKVALEEIRVRNGMPPMALDFARPEMRRTSPKETFARQLDLIFGERFFLTTVIIVYTCFVLNLLLFGCLYAFPQVVPDLHIGGTPVGSLFSAACIELVGYAGAITIGSVFTRKLSLRLFLLFACSALVAFTLGLSQVGKDAVGGFWVTYGYYGIKLFPTLGFTVVYQYASEMYPTEVRASGTSMALAGGRLAGITSPVLYETMKDKTGGYTAFFWLITICVVLNFVLVEFLPYETSDAVLEDSAGACGHESLSGIGGSDMLSQQQRAKLENDYGALGQA